MKCECLDGQCNYCRILDLCRHGDISVDALVDILTPDQGRALLGSVDLETAKQVEITFNLPSLFSVAETETEHEDRERLLKHLKRLSIGFAAWYQECYETSIQTNEFNLLVSVRDWNGYPGQEGLQQNLDICLESCVSSYSGFGVSTKPKQIV